MYTKISYSRMKVLINTLETSDKQGVDLATETLYSQQVEGSVLSPASILF